MESINTRVHEMIQRLLCEENKVANWLFLTPKDEKALIKFCTADTVGPELAEQVFVHGLRNPAPTIFGLSLIFDAAETHVE